MQEIDWSSLGFAYMPTRSHIRYHWKDGAWDKGTLVQGDTITMSIAAGCLHYGQEAFEGLKVFRQKDGKVVAFRPEANAERMQRTAVRTVMPPVPTEMFLDALDRVVAALRHGVLDVCAPPAHRHRPADRRGADA